MASQSLGDIVFKLNNGILTLSLEPGEGELRDCLLNDDAYTISYIKMLITNPLYILTEDELLNELYLPQIGPMKKFKTKKVMWLQISIDLEKILGTTKTPLQIENRYKTVLKRKKKAVENNSKSGSSRQTVPFEDELQKISRLDDSIEPEVLRSAKAVQYPKRPLEESCAQSCSNSTKNTDSPTQPKKKNSFEQMLEIQRLKEEAKDRRYREKLELIKQLFANQKNTDM